MNQLKKTFLMIILLCIVFFCLPIAVSANSPAPANYLRVVLSNIPDNAVYADLLIKIDEHDEKYVDFQMNEFADTASKASDIVNYSQDGFYSFTFHYRNSKSNIKIEHYHDELYTVDFCKRLEKGEYLTQYESLLNDYRNIKIVLLDNDFNIITVSDPAQLPQKGSVFVFYGVINYDFNTNAIDVETHIDTISVIIIVFFSVLIMLISIVTEYFTALFFGFKRLRTIFVVNLCSQIIMRALYVALPLSYMIETILLELIIYGCEFLIYKKLFKEVSASKLLCYTVIANTLSLLLGIFLDCYILA